MSLPARLALFIRAFAEQLWSLGVTVPGSPITHAGAMLIMRRIQCIPQMLEAILARRAAGTLRPPVQRTAPRPSTKPRPPALPWPQRMPNHHAWLVRMGMSFAPYKPFAPFGTQLEHLLRDPELRALVDAVPQLRRAFRPLCRMLGVIVLKQPPPQPKPAAVWPKPSATPDRPGLGPAPLSQKFA